ncbi:Sir2 family NAD-dependent protein deacetylase [Kingella negevensis]|uniref:Sir2 family NAD-dependent protein deacetylase n=1 Tax=Kingella negevensis TaxID=1522312 RepID=UPI0025435E08|nr:Sir2 family NAD-dependent protein deacetylase [Kingella negevensis]WII92239.1 Sir2 family NAD-dependent protein deacetylase [Kingella negevensis]
MKKPICVVLSGAGISVESGLSTFRGNGGLWAGYRIEDVCTPEGFKRDPQQVLDFYNTRHQQAELAQPNAAHKLLAELESVFEMKIVTQNVDDLHERGGSSEVLHLHGELNKMRSTVDTDYIVPCTKDITRDDKDPNGFVMRPHIVWFGESVPLLDTAIEWAQTADVMLIIGTSLQVYPANMLLNYVSPDVPIFVIDPAPMGQAAMANVEFVKNTASAGLASLKPYLLKLANAA